MLQISFQKAKDKFKKWRDLWRQNRMKLKNLSLENGQANFLDEILEESKEEDDCELHSIEEEHPKKKIKKLKKRRKSKR